MGEGDTGPGDDSGVPGSQGKARLGRAVAAALWHAECMLWTCGART